MLRTASSARFWWRTGEPDVTGPARGQPADGLVAVGPGVWRPASNGMRPRRRYAAIGLAGAALVALATTLLDRVPGSTVRFTAEADRLFAVFGFGIDQVSVTGHRFTPDGDILDALRLSEAPTMARFDARDAKLRIERLPWVARADIVRVVPGQLEVRIAERAAEVLWTHDGTSRLIDGTGRILGVVPASTMPGLPRLAGAGADAEVRSLLALLAGYPEIARRLAVAKRVGGRRWTLVLGDGIAVHLPESGEASALERLRALAEFGSIPASAEIDLRNPARLVVRPAGAGRRAGSSTPAGGSLC